MERPRTFMHNPRIRILGLLLAAGLGTIACDTTATKLDPGTPTQAPIQMGQNLDSLIRWVNIGEGCQQSYKGDDPTDACKKESQGVGLCSEICTTAPRYTPTTLDK